MKRRSVIATFESAAAAKDAVGILRDKGFSTEDFSILVSDESKGRHFSVDSGNKGAEGLGTGAAVGGLLGALTAGLTAVGTVASGGALLAAGPIVAALAGAGAGGATGGLIGGLIGLGIPEHQAQFSAESVSKGNILVGVSTDNSRVQEVESLLKAHGAIDTVRQS